MQMNYNRTIDYLYGLQKHGIKLGLANTSRLLSLLNNPERAFKAIHIAGTNGKGSTAAMTASMLKAAGFRTGLFTSPHLVSFTERIKVDDEEIEEAEVIELADEIREIISSAQQTDKNSRSGTQDPELAGHGLNPTFFEFVTAMAFLYFRRKGVGWAVVETGMGGRLDATNVLLPEVSAITSVSHDHGEFLGKTLRGIAAEKAGIIKSGIPVVTSPQDAVVMETIRTKAAEEKAVVYEYGRDFFSCLEKDDIMGITFDYKGRNRLDGLYAPLCGMHQMENASVAVKTIELIMEKEPVSAESVRKGLAGASWPGRLELMKMPGTKYDILIDGAHNPSAAERLAGSLRGLFARRYGRITLILGIMSDKDLHGIMAPLLPSASEIILTAPDYARAASPERLAETARSLGFESSSAGSVREALDMAIAKMGGHGAAGPQLIVITGSFYTIGEAKTILGHKGTLTRLRE